MSYRRNTVLWTAAAALIITLFVKYSPPSQNTGIRVPHTRSSWTFPHSIR